MKSLLAVLADVSVFMTGCGAASPGCTFTNVLYIQPATAAANHTAAAPGNQAQFTSEITFTSTGGCAVPALGIQGFPNWTNPDPATITISSAKDDTNGLATCKAGTNGPVTLTATQNSTNVLVSKPCSSPASKGWASRVSRLSQNLSLSG